MADEYVFIDEWDIDAPQEAVCVSQQEFKGRLPYHLKTRSEIVRLERPNEFEVNVVGDLAGKGVWTLTPRNEKVHIHFDWRVIADRPLLRILTPVLRPVFRLNHKLVDQTGDRGPRAVRPGPLGRVNAICVRKADAD